LEAFCYNEGMNNVFANGLPTGYYFVFKEDILPEEIISLRESVNWKGDSPNRWTDVIRQSLFLVGIRDYHDELVGMACLAGNARHAIMCDLCVSPAHQTKGIGEAIIHQLYDAVHELNVSYVYAELAKTNPFKSKMLDSGFKETGDSLFWDVYN